MKRRIEPGPEFAALFTGFEHSAWRLETHPSYEVSEEAEAFARFVETGEVDVSYLAGWLAGVRTATAAGKRFERVRIVTVPPTDYLRFEMAVAVHNTAAGEDIRTLTEREARSLGLPRLHDFWIFDDKWVAILHFSPTGRLLDAEVSDDPDTLAQHQEWQTSAWRHAEPALV